MVQWIYRGQELFLPDVCVREDKREGRKSLTCN